MMGTLAHRAATLRMKVTTTFVRRVVVLVRPLADETHDFPLPAGLHLVVVGERNLPAYLALRPEQDRALPLDRLARGDRCFAVADGAQLVHATWASPTSAPLPYLDADVPMTDGDVCFYDSYTARAWRSRDLSRCRDELCRAHFRAAGLRRAVALIARENAAGLRTAEPLGYRAIGEYGVLRLGTARRRWLTAFGAERVPRLVARA